jgi:hypothetical protein
MESCGPVSRSWLVCFFSRRSGWKIADYLGEVRAALEAASRLPYEIRGQIETLSSTASPPPSQGQGGVKKSVSR